MTLTFPLTCEVDFPLVADCDVFLLAGRKSHRFQWGSSVFQVVEKVLFSWEVWCVFCWHYPHASVLHPVLTPCPCNLYETKRMNPRFVSLRVLDIKKYSWSIQMQYVSKGIYNSSSNSWVGNESRYLRVCWYQLKEVVLSVCVSVYIKWMEFSCLLICFFAAMICRLLETP